MLLHFKFANKNFVVVVAVGWQLGCGTTSCQLEIGSYLKSVEVASLELVR